MKYRISVIRDDLFYCPSCAANILETGFMNMGKWVRCKSCGCDMHDRSAVQVCKAYIEAIEAYEEVVIPDENQDSQGLRP